MELKQTERTESGERQVCLRDRDANMLSMAVESLPSVPAPLPLDVTQEGEGGGETVHDMLPHMSLYERARDMHRAAEENRQTMDDIDRKEREAGEKERVGSRAASRESEDGGAAAEPAERGVRKQRTEPRQADPLFQPRYAPVSSTLVSAECELPDENVLATSALQRPATAGVSTVTGGSDELGPPPFAGAAPPSTEH